MRYSTLPNKLAVIGVLLVALAQVCFAKEHKVQLAPDQYSIFAIDRNKSVLTLEHESQYTAVRVRADAEITINGATATLDQLAPNMIVKVTFAEPNVVQKVDANGEAPIQPPAGQSPAGGTAGSIVQPLNSNSPASPTPAAVPISGALDSAGLARQLANTKWATSAYSSDGRKWFRLNADMTVTAGWYGTVRPWKVIDAHSISCVLNFKPHQYTLTLNADLTVATCEDGEVFRRLQ